MTLTLNTHLTLLTYLFEYFNQLCGLELQFLKQYIIFTFAYAKAYVTKIDHNVKQVKVNTGS